MSTHTGGTRGSGVSSSAVDVHEMSVVRGVCGMCDMCMCLARDGRCWWCEDWVWALPILEKQGESGVFWLRWCGGSVWAAWARDGGVKSVFVLSMDSLC